MTFYTDSDTYYTTMRALFDCVSENYPKVAEAITRARINIAIRTTAPNATIVLFGREKPMRTVYGEAGGKPDLEIEMSTETFHKILLGDLSLKSALGSGQMKVKGPIWKAMALGDLFTVSRKCYPDIIRGQA